MKSLSQKLSGTQSETDVRENSVSTASRPPVETAFVGRGKRLQQLASARRQGVYLMPRTRCALEMCERFRISLSTAYKHLRRGSLPAENRLVGRDGKYRPAGTCHRLRSPAMVELMAATSALRRAQRKCDSPSVDEISLAEQLGLLAWGILARWKGET